MRRRKSPGWDGADFDDAKWKPPVVSGAGDEPVFSEDKQGHVAHGKIEISAYPGDPIRVQDEIKRRKSPSRTPGVYVFDLGQNMVGWAQLQAEDATRASGSRFAIQKCSRRQGTPYTIPLRGARVTDHYIAKGGGEETWEPIFTSHGFRYVEITGLKEKPSLDAVTGIVAHADMPRTGYFESLQRSGEQAVPQHHLGPEGQLLRSPHRLPAAR